MRNRLEVKPVPIDLHKHERAVTVETGFHQVTVMEVIPHKLPGAALDEGVDSVFGLDALVSMLVTGENCIDSIQFEQEASWFRRSRSGPCDLPSFYSGW
jgi:hypothetical protein